MFNVSTSAYDLTTKQDIWISTEPAPSCFQPFLQCSLPPNNNTAEGALRWRIHLVAASGCWCISVSVCVCLLPTGATSRVDAVLLLQMILWETYWQPSSVWLHMPHHHTHTHTHITSLQLPTVSEACWSQSKLPLHILSAQRKCQSACPSQLKRCVYASKIYLTSCPSWLLTANNTVLAWTMPLF